MKRAFFTLFKQDFLLSWRNGLILVTIISLVVIVALYWSLPLLFKENISAGQSQVFLDKTEGRLLALSLAPHAPGGELFVADRAELDSRLAKKAGAYGIIAEGNREGILYTLVFTHTPDNRTVNIIKAVLRDLSAAITGKTSGTPVKLEALRTRVQPVASNAQLIAVMLAFEVMILGFLFAAVVVFGEKKEGSIRAYRVSPAGLVNYVLSKTLYFTLLSVLYGMVMVAATLGFRVNYPALFAVLLPSCALMTLLGLGIAVFFKNISEWFVPGVLVLSINMLSILPYQFPAYSAFLFTLLPGYNVIFGVSEILFPTGKTGFLYQTLGTSAVQVLLAGIFAFLAVRRKIMKEA